jgi:uncharacterized lipoprotein YmbA
VSNGSALHNAPRGLRRAAHALPVLFALALAACTAAPPLKVYVLSEDPSQNAASTAAAGPASSRDLPVIEVTRVTVPPYLDSRDVIVREGNVLERSPNSRWATRLSVGATELLTARLEQHESNAWVTDQPQARAADYRLGIHISRLDISRSGGGLIEAEWELVPHSASGEVIRRMTRFEMEGSVANDTAVANFEGALLDRLADEISRSLEPAISASNSTSARKDSDDPPN